MCFVLFFDRDGGGGALAHAPNVEAQCVLYCFLTGMVGGALAHAPNVEAECVLYCFLTGMVGGAHM